MVVSGEHGIGSRRQMMAEYRARAEHDERADAEEQDATTRLFACGNGGGEMPQRSHDAAPAVRLLLAVVLALLQLPAHESAKLGELLGVALGEDVHQRCRNGRRSQLDDPLYDMS